MSVLLFDSLPILTGIGGELTSVRVSVEPRALEDLLECLASLTFPVNPEIRHGVPTVVEFPAWLDRLSEVEVALNAGGFDQSALEARDMLATIAVHPAVPDGFPSIR